MSSRWRRIHFRRASGGSPASTSRAAPTSSSTTRSTQLEEYPEHVGWGHSDFKRTLEFARIAGVKRLITFHHDPGHDDQSMDNLIYEARGTNLPFTLHPGTEGLTLEI